MFHFLGRGIGLSSWGFAQGEEDAAVAALVPQTLCPRAALPALLVNWNKLRAFVTALCQ